MESNKMICFECLLGALADKEKTFKEIQKSYFLLNETVEQHNARVHPEGIDMNAGQQAMEDAPLTPAASRYYRFMTWMITPKAEREADPRG
jgi:hypothetical protein